MDAREAVKGKSLLIVTPCYEGRTCSSHEASLVASLRILWEMGVEATFEALPGDSYVDRAKNILLTRWYNNNLFTHMVMIDSDESWNPEALVMMLAADREIVGGVYLLKNNWQEWGCTIETDEFNIPVCDQHGFIKARILPGGFMMISRTAIDRMKEAHPGCTYWIKPVAAEGEKEYLGFYECLRPMRPDGKTGFQGEDVTFCKRFIEAGGELWLYPNVTIGHTGTKEWTGNYHEYLLGRPGGAKAARPVYDEKVSIIIPCYNYGRFLGDAIESAMRQTYANTEIIVVDDGSTDETPIEAAMYPVNKYIRQENKGVAAARNAGIAASTGDWIMCLDADDMITPAYIEECLSERDGCDIIGTAQRTIGVDVDLADDNAVTVMKESVSFADLLNGNKLHVAALHKRRVWETIGGYNDGFEFYEDWEYWMRALKAGFKAKNIREPVFLYRKHGESMITRADNDARNVAMIERIVKNVDNFQVKNKE